MHFYGTLLHFTKITCFGLPLWLLCLTFIALFLMITALCHFFHQTRPKHNKNLRRNFSTASSAMDRRLLSRNAPDFEMSIRVEENRPKTAFPFIWSRRTRTTTVRPAPTAFSFSKYGTCYALGEIRAATNGFADENVISSNGCGIVYRGVFLDNTAVAVRKFLISCDAEVLKMELSGFGHARHRNLVKLLGYCIEGDQRMFVHEYVSNGNLHHWLHRCTAQISPLTWGRRRNIIIGIAKGLAYLHEDIDPKIVHKNLRSSNVLLDHQWNPKIADFGLEKLFKDVITHTTIASGYSAPECGSIGDLMDTNDVYSFGVLVMEIVSGRTPIDHSRSQAYLVDWMKSMVAKQEFDQVVDTKVQDIPSLKDLKRIILIALRCTDPDPGSRPVMGDVIHMLEPRDLLLSGEQEIRRADSYRNHQQEV